MAVQFPMMRFELPALRKVDLGESAFVEFDEKMKKL